MDHGERIDEPIKEVWRRNPQRGPGTEPPNEGQGTKPPEAESLLPIFIQRVRIKVIAPHMSEADCFSQPYNQPLRLVSGGRRSTHARIRSCIGIS